MSWTWICHGYVWQHIVYQYVARELKPRCGKLGLRYRSRVGNCRKERDRQTVKGKARGTERDTSILFFFPSSSFSPSTTQCLSQFQSIRQIQLLLLPRTPHSLTRLSRPVYRVPPYLISQRTTRTTKMTVPMSPFQEQPVFSKLCSDSCRIVFRISSEKAQAMLKICQSRLRKAWRRSRVCRSNRSSSRTSTSENVSSWRRRLVSRFLEYIKIHFLIENLLYVLLFF